MNPRWLRVFVFALPLLAVVWAGGLWFFGRVGQRWTARVWVATTEPGRVLLRARILSFPERSAPQREVSVWATIAADGASSRLQGQTDYDGFVDFEVRLPTTASPALWLEIADEAPLGFGPWDATVLGPPLRPRDGGAARGAPDNERDQPGTVVHLKPQGPAVTLALRHGVLTVPVEDELHIDWAAGSPNGSRQLELELEGASGPLGRHRFMVSSGETISIAPSAHVVEATLRERRDGEQVNTGVTLLPVRPGAIAARLSSDGVLRVISPVPRFVAHVAWASQRHVFALRRVALHATASDTDSDQPAAPRYEGSVELPPEVAAAIEQEGVWAVTSSDADFDTEARVGWPLGERARGRATSFEWGLSLDAYADLAARLAEERAARRRCAWGGLLLLCVVELALVWALDRRAATVDGSVTSTTRSWFWIACFCVVLGFSGLGSLFGFW